MLAPGEAPRGHAAEGCHFNLDRLVKKLPKDHPFEVTVESVARSAGAC